VYRLGCSAWFAKYILLEYLKVKIEGALAQTKPELDPVQVSGQSLLPGLSLHPAALLVQAQIPA